MSPKLTELIDTLAREFRLAPVMAAELECYVLLPDEQPQTMDAFWKPIHSRMLAEGLALLRIEKERGAHQYEIVTGTGTPQQLIHLLSRVRTLMERQAKTMQVEYSLAAKPFPDQPSSGLHLHLHLADEAGVNAYHKTQDWTGDDLRYSLGGLLATLNESLPVFFPSEEDYARLEDADHVPKIAGWGVNNRYCALRIPATPDPYDKRIEHRVPCANADPEAAITAMLHGVVKGLRERIEPPAQSYGKYAALAA